MRNICALYFLACVMCFAQEREIDKNLLYSDVRVLFTDGNLYGGFLSGLRNDSLFFIVGGNHQAVSYRDIRSLVIHREGGNFNHALTGFFGGLLFLLIALSVPYFSMNFNTFFIIIFIL